MKQPWFAQLYLGAMLGATLLVAACERSHPATASAATRVATAVATSGAATPGIHIHGVIASRDELRLSFKVGGIVKRMTVEAGDSVHKGQLLAEIELAEVNSQVAQAQEMASKAERDLQRGERLRADEVISLEQLQNLRTQYEMAAAQLRSAQFNRSYAVITAPSDGTVLRRLAEEHELVPAGQPVLLLGSATRGYVVRAAISDRELLLLKRGDAARVELDAAPGQPLQGVVSELARAADTATGLFPIEIQLATTAMPLVSGMVARADLQPANGGPTLTRIPAGALVAANGDHASVFVQNGDRAQKREVQIAFLDGDEVALRSGVTAGESVVSAGAPYLDDNQLIKVAAQ
jgi:membrane fusion protein, multidrug efflux system